jgi:hypothetical protein
MMEYVNDRREGLQPQRHGDQRKVQRTWGSARLRFLILLGMAVVGLVLMAVIVV